LARSNLSDRERLIAEQAVETLRALDRAADDAPHGQGLACMEAAIHDKGFDLLRAIMTSTASARTEAQKKGSVSGTVAAVAVRSSKRARRGRS
jgi:DNA-binding IclR family transcriptional regulator